MRDPAKLQAFEPADEVALLICRAMTGKIVEAERAVNALVRSMRD